MRGDGSSTTTATFGRRWASRNFFDAVMTPSPNCGVGPDDQRLGLRVVEDRDRHDMRHAVGPDCGKPAEPLTVQKLNLGIGERTHGTSLCRPCGMRLT